MVAIGELQLPGFQPQPGTGLGRYIQSTGTAIVNTTLRLGQEEGNVQGFYTLSGSASLSVGDFLSVRNGVYTQTGGVCNITGFAVLGTLFAPTQGGIDMRGGILSIANGISQQSGASTFTGGQTTIGAAISILNAASIVLSGGNLSVGSIVVDFPFAQMVQNGGALNSTNQIDVRNTATYRYNAGELSAGSIDIKNGGQFLMGSGANKVARTKGILTSGTGKVDLADNAATVDYTGASPIASIRSQIVSAYNGGSWNGSGIGSSFSAANPSYGIGYAEASELGSIPSIFGTVDSDTVLIRTTRYGDADLSGFINLADFNHLAANFGTGDVWSEGDFNYDGVTNLSDFNLLAANFGLAASADGPTPQDWATLAAVVPEPAIIMGCGLMLALLRLRRRSSISPSERAQR